MQLVILLPLIPWIEEGGDILLFCYSMIWVICFTIFYYKWELTQVLLRSIRYHQKIMLSYCLIALLLKWTIHGLFLSFLSSWLKFLKAKFEPGSFGSVSNVSADSAATNCSKEGSLMRQRRFCFILVFPPPSFFAITSYRKRSGSWPFRPKPNQCPHDLEWQHLPPPPSSSWARRWWGNKIQKVTALF